MTTAVKAVYENGVFKPKEPVQLQEKTEVEVLFAQSPSGTLVTVTHRGWAAIRPDHPARHGHDVEAFIRMMGLWWGDLVTSLREHVLAQN